MSGTSFDGVDAAIIKTDGQHYIKRIETSFIKYSKSEKALYQTSILKNYKKITEVIDNKHKEVIKKILKKFGAKVDIIGLHGQTFFHNPNSGWSWQYINSKKIMRYFKTNVVSDFRVADINKGGEGAPLVPIFHKNLILQKNFDLPVGVLNIGGVSNITIIKNKNDFLGFDTGPGNGPLDLLVYNRLNMSMDKNGSIANKGRINNKIKEKTVDLLRKNFQTISFDRNSLDNVCLTYMASLDIKDALATLVAIITEIIYLKAEAFGYLAVRSILGKTYTFKNTTGVSKSSSGGILYYYKG